MNNYGKLKINIGFRIILATLKCREEKRGSKLIHASMHLIILLYIL